ncbi:MAG: 1-deoxy-D-xylulose-5-phosphate synthase N-terminal domain-containing protein [Candidatus Gracilibacteria bacterium]
MNQRQRELRLSALEIICKSGKGHSGRMLSSIDLLEGLYFGRDNERQIFKHNPHVPQMPDRDYFVLSKLEALPALYAVLKKDGHTLPEVLPEYPDRKVPGVEVTTREHAYGLSVAVGLAESIKVDHKNQHVFCLVGDYELAHGKAWESIMTASEHRLDRLCLILDENDPKDEPIQERFESFGWKVIKLQDAHDHDEIAYGYMRARLTLRKPTCIWAPTKKSAGIPFAERKIEYDDTVFSASEMEEIRKILL